MPRGVNVRFLRLSRNLGFGAANNFALSHASSSSKYVALINSDLAPERNSLKVLVQFLETHPEVGGVQGKILTWDGGRIDNAGVYLSSGWYVFPRGVMRPAETEYEEASVSYLDGAYSVYPITAIRKVGGLFIEDFFLYGDDLELSARLWRAGFALKYCPMQAGRHYRGATLESLGGILTYFRWRGQSGAIVAHERYWLIVLLLRLPLVFRSTMTYAKYATIGILDGVAMGLRLKRRYSFLGSGKGPRLSIPIARLWAMIAKLRLVNHQARSNARRELSIESQLSRTLEKYGSLEKSVR